MKKFGNDGYNIKDWDYNVNMKNIYLFIDESGGGNPKSSKSECYTVCGCLVLDNKRDEIKIKADQIKFKYWSRTDVIFHSKEIGRKEGDFKILKDKKIAVEFYKDLFNFLSSSSLQLFIALVDQKKALNENWNSQKVYKETADTVIRNFILSLIAIGEVRGKLMIESATAEKDFIYHKTAGFYLSNGINNLGISFKEVQDVLTEVSFVTKKNHDIEEQIADLMAYGAKLKFIKKKQTEMNPYQLGILKIMNSKLFKMHPDTGARKKKYYEQIDSFKIVP